MLRIAVNQIQIGMRLALPVHNPNRRSDILLKTGYTLDQRTLDRLNRFDIREVWVRYPGTDEIRKRIKPEIFEQRETLSQNVCDMMLGMQKSTNSHMGYLQYTKSISEMISSLLADRSTIIFVGMLNQNNTTLMSHSSSVAFLSILMGIKLDAYLINQRKRIKPNLAKDVTNLGIGAMFHDIGLLSIDSEVMEAYEETRVADDEEYRKHPVVGYKEIRGKIDPSAAAVALQHHHHFDGSGYPNDGSFVGLETSLSGKKIHVYSRIVTVADTFESLHHPRHDVTVPIVRAMAMMLEEPLINWFDPIVLRAFFTVVAPYAPGVLVELSDGRFGVVIDHHPAEPCRPIVQLLGSPDLADGVYNGDVQTDDHLPLIDLLDHLHLHVVKCGDDEVGDFNFSLPEGMKRFMPRRRKRRAA